MLSGYAKFLQDKDFSLDKHQPYLVGPVRGFLLFARGLTGYSFVQTLDLFSAARVGQAVLSHERQIYQPASVTSTEGSNGVFVACVGVHD